MRLEIISRHPEHHGHQTRAYQFEYDPDAEILVSKLGDTLSYEVAIRKDNQLTRLEPIEIDDSPLRGGG